MPKAFEEADRAQSSFLAPIEKRFLIWLARRTPGWMHSDSTSPRSVCSRCWRQDCATGIRAGIRRRCCW